MSVLTRPAVLLATASMAVGLLSAPSAAWAADTTTNLTAAEMTVALQAVSDASEAAGAGGWRADMKLAVVTHQQTIAITEVTQLDPANGLFTDRMDAAGFGGSVLYAAVGKGFYQSVNDPQQTSALTMMGRPSVGFVFTADKSLRMDDIVGDAAPFPVTDSQDEVLAGTKTVHDDGSVDYRMVSEKDGTVTMHAAGNAVLTGVDMIVNDEGGTSTATIALSYGAQQITLPAPSATIDDATMAKGIAYLDMPALVKSAATKGAAATRKAAKGGTVKVATLRKLVRRDVTAVNHQTRVTVVKAKNTSGGVRVYATNPWTKKSVAYTVKASGRKVVTKKV